MTAERAINPNIFDPDPSPGLPPALRGAQHIIDRHFTHLSAGKVPEINGTLDLETERALFSADDPLLDLITGGRFPAYAYANIDVLHACRRLAGGSSRPPRPIIRSLAGRYQSANPLQRWARARRLVHQDAPASPRTQHPAHLEV